MDSSLRILTYVLFTGLTAGCFAQTAGQAIGVTPVAGKSGTDTRPFVIGYEFSVSNQTTVTNLGYLDATSAGLNEAHQVAIFDAANGSVLVSATIPAGTSAGLINGFRVMPVNYSLAPGDYVIGGMDSTDVDYAIVQSTGTTSPPGIQYIQERELQTSTFAIPTTNFTLDEVGSFGPGFTVAAPGVPVITGVYNGASFQPVFAPNTYLSITGTALSADPPRVWNASDFANGTQMPTSLNGVTVTVGGSPAYIEYVSSTQLNIITPNITPAASGVPLIVNVPGQQPVTAWLAVANTAPAFFMWETGTTNSGKYLVAQHANYTNVGAAGLFPNEPANYTTPAVPGETIILYGTGLGPTTPAIAPGIMTDKIYPVVPLPTATIGGMPAQVQFAGLIPTLSQVYQVNVTIPEGIAAGDAQLIVNVNGTNSATGLITIGQ